MSVRKNSSNTTVVSDVAQPLEATYKGALPSQKYFTPQELSNLSRIGK
jgi:hypothetical protein